MQTSQEDPSGLGRWTSMQFQGKGNHKLRVITAYNPCRNRGLDAVYQQHLRHLRRQGINTTPEQSFQDGLVEEIKKWQDNGEHIVLTIDANQDIRTGRLAKAFAEIGLQEAIVAKHPHLDPPATHNKNQSNTPLMESSPHWTAVTSRADTLPLEMGSLEIIALPG